MEQLCNTHVTVRQLAARWSVSTTFVRAAIARGSLRATRFGRAVRVATAEAERFAAERTNRVVADAFAAGGGA
jgi:excisionase family DNA binding protein